MSVKMEFEASYNWPKYKHNRNVMDNHLLAPQPPHFYHNSKFAAAIPHNFFNLKHSNFRNHNFFQTRIHHNFNRKDSSYSKHKMSFDTYNYEPVAGTDEFFAGDNAFDYIPMALTAANYFADDAYGMNSSNWSGYQIPENEIINAYEAGVEHDASFAAGYEAWDGGFSDPASSYGTPGDSTYGSTFDSPEKSHYTVPDDAILPSQSFWPNYSDDILPSPETQALTAPSVPETATAATPLHDPTNSLSWRDAFIIEKKSLGWTYRQIKEFGGLQEAESTLRGRYRALTKPSGARLRNPKFEAIDDILLVEGVYYHMGLSQDDVKDAEIDTKKVPWKKVAEYIIENGGSYHFGNATVKKQWTKLLKAALRA